MYVSGVEAPKLRAFPAKGYSYPGQPPFSTEKIATTNLGLSAVILFLFLGYGLLLL